MRHPMKLAALGLAAALCASAVYALGLSGDVWTRQELAILASLQLDRLPPAPTDTSNRVEAMPAAARLGKQLFFDGRLSANGAVSCASCHDPGKQFQDGKPIGQGIAMGQRRTMPIASAAHSPFLFWDGRKDSLWAQALGPLEDAAEHGGNRLAYARLVLAQYRQPYESLFGPAPQLPDAPAEASPLGTPSQRQAWLALPAPARDDINRVFANMGKAIAAYEKTLTLGKGRVDDYIAGVLQDDPVRQAQLSAGEKRGLRLFIGKAQCATCHNGPLFSDQQFHNTGIAPHGRAELALGRRSGVDRVRQDEFNCLGPYSDAGAGQCEELRFMATDGPTLEAAFKTPSLRNVATRAPFMHAGQLGTLDDVLKHYSAAPRARLGRSELRPLRLSAEEQADLAAFLAALNSPIIER